jgi:predicted PurR-regulated permease PerM
MTKAERSDMRTAGRRGVDIPSSSPAGSTDSLPFRTDGPGNPSGTPPGAPPVEAATSPPPDIDPRSAIPLAIALASMLVVVWVLRSIPRTLTAVAVAALFALALNRVVEVLQRRTSWARSTCVVVVLLSFTLVVALVIALLVPPTIHEVRAFNKQVPQVVRNLDDVPIFGDRLREADAPRKVQRWLDELPRRLSAQHKPLDHVAGAVATGVGSFLLTMVLAIALLLDAELIITGLRHAVPERRRKHADRLGALVYDVVGKYIAGSLLMATVAAAVMLSASLLLGVPLAPLIAVWVAMTNPIPQVGGALGGVVFVTLGLTQGVATGVICLVVFLAYQQLENHVLQPLIIGRAVRLSPPTTMIAALVGVSAGGVIGALFAVPIVGAVKAIYLATRRHDVVASDEPV